MKHLYIYIIIMLGVIGITSCSNDFLIEYPQTQIVASTFYKTPAHFDQAITAAYVRLRDVALNSIMMDEMRADNSYFTRYYGDRGPYTTTEVIALFLDDLNSGLWINNRYNNVYNGVFRCNAIIDRVDDSELTDAQKNAVIAEAKFLRAFYYFDLVTHWGPVPLIINEVTTSDQAFEGNSTIEQIYSQILTDVSDAINAGTLPVATTFPQSGKITMGAAKMLRAYVNMTKPTRDYPAAERDLKDITNMNYALETDYARIFAKNNKNGRESIFEVQYREGTTGLHQVFSWKLIPKCRNIAVLMGIGGSNSAGDGSGGWVVPTQQFIDAYEAGDKRLSASIGVIQGVGDQDITVDAAEPVLDIVGFTRQEGKDYHYFVRKFYHPPYANSGQADDNFPMYRYADCLLLLAESLVEQGKNGEAQTYLDQVRDRAGLASVPATKQSVLDERRFELAFESKRWTDLIRSGQAVNVMNEFGRYIKSIDPVILDVAFNVTQDKLLFPFQSRELRVNPNLTQNPGYETYWK